jgi:hypothetical protein
VSRWLIGFPLHGGDEISPLHCVFIDHLMGFFIILITSEKEIQQRLLDGGGFGALKRILFCES